MKTKHIQDSFIDARVIAACVCTTAGITDRRGSLSSRWENLPGVAICRCGRVFGLMFGQTIIKFAEEVADHQVSVRRHVALLCLLCRGHRHRSHGTRVPSLAGSMKLEGLHCAHGSG